MKTILIIYWLFDLSFPEIHASLELRSIDEQWKLGMKKYRA